MCVCVCACACVCLEEEGRKWAIVPFKAPSLCSSGRNTMPQQEKTTQQREQQEQEKEQQQRFAEQQQRFVDQQQLVHQQQQQQLLALQRQLLEAQAQIGYVPLHMQAYGGTLPSMGSLVGHYPMSQFGPYGFMAYDAVPGTANAAAYNAFRFPHMFHGAQVSAWRHTIHCFYVCPGFSPLKRWRACAFLETFTSIANTQQVSTGLPLQYYAGASGAIPPAVGESHFSAQGQFHQQVTQPEDSSAEQTGSTPHPRKRTFRNVNSRSCSDHNDVSAEENCQADVETATHAAGDIHSNGVLLSDIIKSGIIKAGENNLTLTYKGVTVRLHLSSIGSIIWYGLHGRTNLPLSALVALFAFASPRPLSAFHSLVKRAPKVL